MCIGLSRLGRLINVVILHIYLDEAINTVIVDVALYLIVEQFSIIP